MFTLSHAVRMGVSALKIGVYSLLVGPGVMLIGLLMLNGHSVSQDILRNAEQLVRNAPADKVWACASNIDLNHPKAASSLAEPPSVTCSLQLQTRDEWIESNDREIKTFYMMAVVVSVLAYAIVFSVLSRTRGREFAYGTASKVRGFEDQREDV